MLLGFLVFISQLLGLFSLFGYEPNTRTQVRLQIRRILFILLDNALILLDNLRVSQSRLLLFFVIDLPLYIGRELHPLCRQHGLSIVVVILCRE